jgi:hypothetical protein
MPLRIRGPLVFHQASVVFLQFSEESVVSWQAVDFRLMVSHLAGRTD